jgi:hypothetical protein
MPLTICHAGVATQLDKYLGASRGSMPLRAEVVPLESAYPGVGEFHVLQTTDHINVCKPIARSDPGYTKLLSFLAELAATTTPHGTPG